MDSIQGRLEKITLHLFGHPPRTHLKGNEITIVLGFRNSKLFSIYFGKKLLPRDNH